MAYGAVETAPPERPIECSPRAISDAISWSPPGLRSTPHDRFHVQESPIPPGPRGLLPQRADFQMRLGFRFAASPHQPFAAHSKVSDVFEISRVRRAHSRREPKPVG